MEIMPGFNVVKAIIKPYGSEVGLWVDFERQSVRTLYRVFPNKDRALAFAKQLTNNIEIKD